MKDIFLVLIGGILAMLGTIITQWASFKATRWQKIQERFDLIFEKRLESYRRMHIMVCELDQAARDYLIYRNKGIQDDATRDRNPYPEKRYKDTFDTMSSYWIEHCVYLPPNIAGMIRNLLFRTNSVICWQGKKDREYFDNAVRECKIALQDLDNISWVPMPRDDGIWKRAQLHIGNIIQKLSAWYKQL